MLIITSEVDQSRVFYDPRVEWHMRVCSLDDLNFGTPETFPDSVSQVVANIGGFLGRTARDFTIYPATPGFNAKTVLVLNTKSTDGSKGPFRFGHRLFTRK